MFKNVLVLNHQKEMQGNVKSNRKQKCLIENANGITFRGAARMRRRMKITLV